MSTLPPGARHRRTFAASTGNRLPTSLDTRCQGRRWGSCIHLNIAVTVVAGDQGHPIQGAKALQSVGSWATITPPPHSTPRTHPISCSTYHPHDRCGHPRNGPSGHQRHCRGCLRCGCRPCRRHNRCRRCRRRHRCPTCPVAPTAAAADAPPPRPQPCRQRIGAATWTPVPRHRVGGGGTRSASPRRRAHRPGTAVRRPAQRGQTRASPGRRAHGPGWRARCFATALVCPRGRGAEGGGQRGGRGELSDCGSRRWQQALDTPPANTTRCPPASGKPTGGVARAERRPREGIATPNEREARGGERGRAAVWREGERRPARHAPPR